MYTHVSCVVLGLEVGAQYVEYEHSTIPISILFNSYSKVYAKVLEVGHIKYIDITLLRNEIRNLPITLPQWFTSIGNRVLTTLTDLPQINTKLISYSDVFRAGFIVDKIPTPETVPVGVNKTKDLMLYKPGDETDMTFIDRYCLTTINGLIHNRTSTTTRTFIKEGLVSNHRFNRNQAGLISFKNIGEITIVPISEQDIYAQNNQSTLRDRTYFSISQNVSSKSVLLVLAGYLVVPQDGVFWSTGNNSFAINVENLALVDRYFEARDIIDLSSLDLTTDENGNIVSDELYSDVNITKLLTLPQSFLVIVNTDNLFYNRLFIQSSGIPNSFTSHTFPRYPLSLGITGRLSEYFSIHERDRWEIRTIDILFQNRVYKDTEITSTSITNDKNFPGKNVDYSNAYLLEIGTIT